MRTKQLRAQAEKESQMRYLIQNGMMIVGLSLAGPMLGVAVFFLGQ